MHTSIRIDRSPRPFATRWRSAALLLGANLWLIQASAQPPPPASSDNQVPPGTANSAAVPASSNDEIVSMPVFDVSAAQDTRMEGTEELSLTRAAMPLNDVAQSVVVINPIFLDAVQPESLADMVAYVGGGQIGNINWGIDRYMIRGFTSQGDFVDGFLSGPGGNAPTTSMYFIDHMEIVKGPAAIMSTNASGVIGGAVNKVSKSPTENYEASLSVEYGRYDDERAIVDVGGPITPDKKLLFRVLGLVQDQKSFYQYQYDKRTDIMPMLSYIFSPTTQVWVKADVLDTHFGSYNGIPLDGRTGQPVAVPPDTNFGEDDPNNWRVTKMWRTWGEFTTHPNEHVAIRFGAIDSSVTYTRTESVLSPSGAGTPTLQPNGSYAYSPYPQYTIPPNYVAGTLIPRATTADTGTYPRREIQNDYDFTFNTGPAANTLLIGADLVDYPQHTEAWSSGGSSVASSPPINPFDPDHAGEVKVGYNLPPTSRQDMDQTYAKAFALETASFLEDRLLLTYGVSRHRFDESSATYTYNQNTGVYGTPSFVPSTTLYKNIVQYGIVAKPLKNVSVFYGRNANFAANPIQNGAFLPPQQGVQKETGVKADIIPGKVNISVSYFELYQVNNTLPAYPATSPQTQVLIPGETSRGFDGDFTVSLIPNLDIVGSFAVFKAHVQLGAPYDLAPEPYDNLIHTTIPVGDISQDNFAIWTRYNFGAIGLHGWTAGVGEQCIAKRAVTDSSNQIFYGYIPGYALTNAFVAWENKHIKIQFNVDNLFNKFYYYSARSNQVIVPGIPINPRVAVTYKY